MSTKQLRTQRKNLWEVNPHCENCGVLTILATDLPYTLNPDGSRNISFFPDNMATIQHKYDKLHPLRFIKNNERRHFLWCMKCNRDHWYQFERERASANAEKIRQQNENKL